MSTFSHGRRFIPTVRRENLRVDGTDGKQTIHDGVNRKTTATSDEPVSADCHSKPVAKHTEEILRLPQNYPSLESEGSTTSRLLLPAFRNAEQGEANIDRRGTMPTPMRLASYHLNAENDGTTRGKRWVTYRTALVFSLGCFIGGIWVGRLPIPWTDHAERSKLDATYAGDHLEAKFSMLDPLDQNKLDEAYRDQKTGKFAEAARILAALHGKHPAWGTVGVASGTMAMYQHEWAAAQVALSGLTSAPMSAAESHLQLGILFTIRKDYDQAKAHFANAVALDPTKPDFYYFWGECLHQEGKQLEAVSKFRSALLRNQFDASECFYRLKLWLCEIQADQENNDGTLTEIEAAMSQVNPPMEANFASAALKIKKGEFNAATNQLLRARELVSPNIYLVIMQDPIFFQESWRPELAPAFKSEDWHPDLIDVN